MSFISPFLSCRPSFIHSFNPHLQSVQKPPSRGFQEGPEKFPTLPVSRKEKQNEKASLSHFLTFLTHTQVCDAAGLSVPCILSVTPSLTAFANSILQANLLFHLAGPWDDSPGCLPEPPRHPQALPPLKSLEIQDCQNHADLGRAVSPVPSPSPGAQHTVGALGICGITQ